MATFNKVNGKWRVQVRKKGITKSAYFRTKAEAQAWAYDIENKILSNDYYNRTPNITFADLLDKYIKEVSVNKRSYREERLRLLRVMDRLMRECGSVIVGITKTHHEGALGLKFIFSA
ncbi:integrase [Actinobacillus porcinus]|uniref:integrase n=1 Tax=Actinobacillus porcinus TaxID=51048 RepID=UPI002352AC11|nr:integrase [Actinobacillus porcinus]